MEIKTLFTAGINNNCQTDHKDYKPENTIIQVDCYDNPFRSGTPNYRIQDGTYKSKAKDRVIINITQRTISFSSDRGDDNFIEVGKELTLRKIPTTHNGDYYDCEYMSVRNNPHLLVYKNLSSIELKCRIQDKQPSLWAKFEPPAQIKSLN